MKEAKTASILQRLSVILAVTAASYGLAQPQVARTPANGHAAHSQQARTAAQQR